MVREYGTRMDTQWSLRSAYAHANALRLAQDAYCAKVEEGLWDPSQDDVPSSENWEALVDVLRGKVKV